MKGSLCAVSLGLVCIAACAPANAQSSVTIGGTMDLGLRPVRHGSSAQ